MIANNPIIMRTFLVMLFPIIFAAHIGYGMWKGVLEAYWEFCEGWRRPTSNRWNKDTW